jgi:hypothetical protein
MAKTNGSKSRKESGDSSPALARLLQTRKMQRIEDRCVLERIISVKFASNMSVLTRKLKSVLRPLSRAEERRAIQTALQYYQSETSDASERASRRQGRLRLTTTDVEPFRRSSFRCCLDCTHKRNLNFSVDAKGKVVRSGDLGFQPFSCQEVREARAGRQRRAPGAYPQKRGAFVSALRRARHTDKVGSSGCVTLFSKMAWIIWLQPSSISTAGRLLSVTEHKPRRANINPSASKRGSLWLYSVIFILCQAQDGRCIGASTNSWKRTGIWLPISGEASDVARHAALRHCPVSSAHRDPQPPEFTYKDGINPQWGGVALRRQHNTPNAWTHGGSDAAVAQTPWSSISTASDFGPAHLVVSAKFSAAGINTFIPG